MRLIDEINNHYLLSIGFTKPSLPDPEETLKQLRAISSEAQVQLVKADLIGGPEHLQFAARNALHSFNGPQRRSKSLAVELLLYISCQRQIAKAIRLLGVDSRDSRVALVALSHSKDAILELDRHANSMIGGKRDENLIEVTADRKMDALKRSYGVTSREMEATRSVGEADSSVLKRLIIERSALLEVRD